MKWLIAAAIALAIPSTEATARTYHVLSVGGINDPCGIPCAPGWSYEYWPTGVVVSALPTVVIHRSHRRAAVVRVRG